MNNFKTFGTMIDCSRNAVMSVDTVKKWIDITSDLGYNTLMLYTEDTYEVKDNPYFGHCRGRYTADEIKEIDKYALNHNMELVPCIQTLAHFDALVRWNCYQPIVDIGNILLAENEKTYELIDKIFCSISECFSSRKINVGMDEAYLVGRGKYHDIHGDTDRTELLVKHISKVAEIAKKYGFKVCMWSDMFYRIAVGDYYDSSVEVKESIKKKIPENVELIYWDYHNGRFDKMIESHQKIKQNMWFAGGFWCWTGFKPHNSYSINNTKEAIKSCIKHKVQNVFLTLWGDNGAECSKFNVLPCVYATSEFAKGNFNEEKIKQGFYQKFGIKFDDFMLVDLPDLKYETDPNVFNSEKYLLYNDVFLGLLDNRLHKDDSKRFSMCAEKLKGVDKNGEYGYLFTLSQKLCEVLSLKADLSYRTKKAYQNDDKKELENLILDYNEVVVRLKEFYEAFKVQWYKENKGFGFEVHDIRIGGLILRISHCTEILKDYLEGKISKIEELEQETLDIWCDEKDKGKATNFNNWSSCVTAGII